MSAAVMAAAAGARGASWAALAAWVARGRSWSILAWASVRRCWSERSEACVASCDSVVLLRSLVGPKEACQYQARRMSQGRK